MCPAVYEMQISVLKNLREALTEAFHNFVNAGLLKKDFTQEYSNIEDAIMTLMVYGLPDFYQTEETNTSILNCVWSIIIPCFTEQGHEKYNLLMPNRKS